MRLLFWGTYDTGKPRSRILISGLRSAGVDVKEIRAGVWDDVADKSQVHSTLSRFGLLLRWLLSYPMLAWRLCRAERPDAIVVGYPGILDILVAAPIARLRGIALFWDMFISIYDTVCMDRALFRPDSVRGRLLYWLERSALHRADLVFMDTRAHAARIERLFGLEHGSCGAVWVGAETEYFTPMPTRPEGGGKAMEVLFYGQFIPLHGIETIVLAARRLRTLPIRWRLIGQGQESSRIRKLLAEDPLPNVDWVEWVEYAELRRSIATADVCLGIFGASEKATSVIPNKVFQIVMSGRPLVTRDSPAIRELLAPGAPCVTLVPPDDPDALAVAVNSHLQLRKVTAPDIRCHVSTARLIDAAAIARQFLEMMEKWKMDR